MPAFKPILSIITNKNIVKFIEPSFIDLDNSKAVFSINEPFLLIDYFKSEDGVLISYLSSDLLKSYFKPYELFLRLNLDYHFIIDSSQFRNEFYIEMPIIL